MDRQIRYHVSSHPLNDPSASYNQLHKWTILIINQNREATQIVQKIVENLCPIYLGPVTIASGNTSSGLRYRLIKLESLGINPSKVNWRKIYQGCVKKDRTLHDRDSIDGLVNFVEEHISSM